MRKKRDICLLKILALTSFDAASKNGGKNLCCLLKIDITSVIDQQTIYGCCFFLFWWRNLWWYATIKLISMPVSLGILAYISQILWIIVRKRQPTAFNCLSLHVMSIFSLLLLFLFFFDRRKLSASSKYLTCTPVTPPCHCLWAQNI